MRIFLAGASGVLGRLLIPTLVAAGHQVTGTTRSAGRAETLRALGAEPAVCDLLDHRQARAAVTAAAPDLVMHQLTDLSAGSLEANARLRTEGTRHLVDAAVAAGVRDIVAQSICWAYAPGEGPATEDEPLDRTAEGIRAATVEAVAALEAGVAKIERATVLRYGMFYGPGTWFAPDGARAEAARRGELVATPDVTSFVHVEDAAAAAVAAIDWPGGVWNVCDDEPAPGIDWVPAFCAAVGADAPPVDAEGPRTGFARGASNARARQLPWTPRWRSWRQGFAALGGG